MFGWDFDEQQSTPSGDILSKPEVLYSSSGFTEECCTAVFLHGCSGVQTLPTRTKICVVIPAFRKGFLRFFFEDDIEMDKLFGPRTERPQHRRSH